MTDSPQNDKSNPLELPATVDEVRILMAVMIGGEPEEELARGVHAALGETPIAVFRHTLLKTGAPPTVPLWLGIAATCKHNYEVALARKFARNVVRTAIESNKASSARWWTSAMREQCIATPLVSRFPDPIAAARIEAGLAAKTASPAQLAVVREIIRRSFSTDPAGWVRPGLVELAWTTGYSERSLEMALWLATVAGIVERRLIDHIWHYTAVPEAWESLPDYPLRPGTAGAVRDNDNEPGAAKGEESEAIA